jgi:hypothetical protein
MRTTVVLTIATEIAEKLYGELDRYDAPRLDHDIYAALKERVESEPLLFDEILGRAAREARVTVERAHAPRRRGDAATLFDPDALVILGDSERVKMRAARRDDSLRRQRVIVANKQAQDQAFFEEMGYWQERDAIWLSHPDLGLEEIERDFFGWE